MKRSYTIVVPARDEEESIEAMLDRIRHYCPEAEILVVDDYSRDRTHMLAEGTKGVEVTKNELEPGFKRALMWSLLHIRTEAVVFVMADGCDELLRVEDMVGRVLDKEADVVCGSRHSPGGHILNPEDGDKALASRLVGWLCHTILRVPTLDATNAFKAWRSDVLREVALTSPNESRMFKGGFECNMEWLLRAHAKGYVITELPTTWVGRRTGRSKFKFLRQAPAYLHTFLKGLVWTLCGC